MSRPFVRLEGATARYGAKTVLSGVTLSIGAGDRLLLCGPNGGGKTTLVRLVVGLLRPAEGRASRQRGLRTGYLPQYRRVDRDFPITVRQTVASGLAATGAFWPWRRAAARRRVQAVLERMGLAPLAERPIGSLSGGQWQRTLLARAAVGRPQLYVLDEPETHLDAEARAELRRFVAGLGPEVAVVVVSHEAVGADEARGWRRLHVDGSVREAAAPALAPAPADGSDAPRA